MRTMIFRAFGMVPAEAVRRRVTEHNHQRATDDEVYRAQTVEIRRLGALLAEIDVRRVRELMEEAERMEAQHRADLEQAHFLVDEANGHRLRENQRMQRLVDEANRLRLEERVELERRANRYGVYALFRG